MGITVSLGYRCGLAFAFAVLGFGGCSAAEAADPVDASSVTRGTASEAAASVIAEAASDAAASEAAASVIAEAASETAASEAMATSLCSSDATSCRAPCPQILDDATIADMCGATHGRIKVGTTPCGGVIVMLVGAADCDTFYLFDATSKRVVESGGGCNGQIACAWSASGAPLAPSCVHGHPGTWFTERGGEFDLRDACELDAAPPSD